METLAKEQTYTNYKSRINNVCAYVETNFDKDISLEELASVSHFSKYPLWISSLSDREKKLTLKKELAI